MRRNFRQPRLRAAALTDNTGCLTSCDRIVLRQPAFASSATHRQPGLPNDRRTTRVADMTDTPEPRLVVAFGASHYTTDTGENPRAVLHLLCGRTALPDPGYTDRAAPTGTPTCQTCASLAPALANPFMAYSRDELAEAVEQIAAAIETSTRLREDDRLHLVTESEMELAETRKRIVVRLFRTGPGRAGWGAGYWSWERIGDRLGISRQAARKTYGPLVERASLADRIARENIDKGE